VGFTDIDAHEVPFGCNYLHNNEPVSKRFSLVKVKAGEHFNRKNTLSILRIEI